MSTTDDGPTRDEVDLIVALLKLEIRVAPPESHDGSAGSSSAVERIRRCLAAMQRTHPAHEHRFRFEDPWGQFLFITLARRYGLVPFRGKRQRRNTLDIEVPHAFIEDILWPLFEAAHQRFENHFFAVTQQVVAKFIRCDMREVEGASESPMHRRHE